MRTDPYAGALRAARDHFSGLEGFQAYAAYLDAKDRGLKREAKAAAERFAEDLRAAGLAAAIEQVRELVAAKAQFADAPALLPHPAIIAAVEICRAWEAAEPGAAEPLLIRAGLQNDPFLIPEALRREPSNPTALKAEIRRVLDWVSFAFHHIGEGGLVGDAPETRAGLADIRTHCARLDDPDWSRPVLEDADWFEAVLDGLEAWAAAGEPGAFADFMRARGVEIAAAPVYYFSG